MTVHEILQLLRIKEKESGYSLENALSLKRYREKSNLQILRPSEAFYLPAVNSKARIKWGRIKGRDTTARDELKRVFIVIASRKKRLVGECDGRVFYGGLGSLYPDDDSR